MTRNEAKRNAILGVFCPKRNMTFFSVSLSKLGTDRNGAERSGTLILDVELLTLAEVVAGIQVRGVEDRGGVLEEMGLEIELDGGKPRLRRRD